MKKSAIRIGAAIGLAGAMVCGVVFVQDGALPAERQQGTVTFITGGIGKDDADAMKKVAKGTRSSCSSSSTHGRATSPGPT